MFKTTIDGNFYKVGTNETHSPESPEFLQWLAQGNTPEPADEVTQ